MTNYLVENHIWCLILTTILTKCLPSLIVDDLDDLGLSSQPSEIFPSVYNLLSNLSRTPSSWVSTTWFLTKLILIGLRQPAGPIRVPHPQQRMWMTLLQSQSGLLSWIELTILEVMVHLPCSGSQPAKSEIWSRCATENRDAIWRKEYFLNFQSLFNYWFQSSAEPPHLCQISIFTNNSSLYLNNSGHRYFTTVLDNSVFFPVGKKDIEFRNPPNPRQLHSTEMRWKKR